VERYTDFTEITVTMLNEFIEKKFPTDFLTYSLSSFLSEEINSIAFWGLSLKNGRLVQILKPSVTALRVFALPLLIHSCIVGTALRDISKKFPDLIKAELLNWDLSSKRVLQVYRLAGKLVIP